MAEKTVKTKQPESKPVQKATRMIEKEREKPKKPNKLSQWWRETMGELRKVSWPTLPDTRRLTIIVLAVMFVMSAILGLLDWIFSKLITLLISL